MMPSKQETRFASSLAISVYQRRWRKFMLKLRTQMHQKNAAAKAFSESVEIIFSGAQYASLHAHLFQENGDEQAAYAFIAPSQKDAKTRLLVHHMIFLQPGHFSEQSGAFLELETTIGAAIAQHAIENRWGLVEIHSHPFADEYVSFSSTDKGFALPRFRWFARKAQKAFAHVMLVFGCNSADGLMYDADADDMRPIEGVTILDAPIRRFPMAPSEAQLMDMAYLSRTSRQAQAFGTQGQDKIAKLSVGIVGLGGVGAFVAHQLALLGVRKFVLVDADVVEATNLNRFVGASSRDVAEKTPKVRVLDRLIRQLDPKTEVVIHQEMFPSELTIKALKHVDVLFGCTDTHGSRLLLNEFALQYMLPYIDIGVGITSDEAGKIREAGGQFRVILPERFCLQCVRALDPDQAARDLLPLESRKLHQERGYIPTENIPAPSVGFLNGTLASLAVGEFLNLVTGFQEPSEIVYYFLKGQSMKRVRATKDAQCVACSNVGRFAMGDLEAVLGMTQKPSSIQHIPSPTSQAE